MNETREIFGEAVQAIEKTGVGYGVFGGVAVWEYGGTRRPTKDIDFLVRPGDADRVLGALASAGFTTERTDPRWLFKAEKNGVNADVIFEVAGGEVPFETVLGRTHRAVIDGTSMDVISPEDIILIKLAVIKAHRPWDWFDALTVMAGAADALDWEYLVGHSRSNPERLLSLLLFAKTSGYGAPVPDEVLSKLASQAGL